MPKASVKRLIECKKDDLINLVLDIEKYPDFVPFCYNAKIYESKNEGDIIKIIADLTIGKGPFKETYENYKVNGDVIEILDYDKYVQNESNQYCIQFSKKIIYKLYNIFNNNK